MLIHTLKIGKVLYKNITINDVYNLLSLTKNISTKREILISTLKYIVGDKILKDIIDNTKKDAAITKAICLLAKIVYLMNPDITQLTEKEKSAFNKMVNLANSGYTDSIMLNTFITSIINNLDWYNSKLNEIEKISTDEEIQEFIQEIANNL